MSAKKQPLTTGQKLKKLRAEIKDLKQILEASRKIAMQQSQRLVELEIENPVQRQQLDKMKFELEEAKREIAALKTRNGNLNERADSERNYSVRLEKIIGDAIARPAQKT